MTEANTFSYKIVGDLVFYYLDENEFVHDKNKLCGEQLNILIDHFNKNQDFTFKCDPCVFSIKSDDPYIYFRNKNNNTNSKIFFTAYKNKLITIASKLCL